MQTKTRLQFDSEDAADDVLEHTSSKADPDDADNDAVKWEKEESKAFHWVKLGIIYSLPFIGAVIIVVYVLNLILPECWRWLSPQDLSGIQSLVVSILSGVSTSLAVNYFYRA